jgi:hypothetical protein
LKSRNIYADGLFAVTVNDLPALLHTEFQTGRDGLMAERLLEYSVLASSENNWLPVYTYVIYLRELELLALAFALGGLVPGDEAYDEWFKRSFAMLEDILEESWTYQEMIKKGMQKGLERGLEQGRQQLVQEQYQTLLSFVRVRFPELVALAKQQTATINDPEILHNLIIKLFNVQSADDARHVLMEVKIQ